MTTKHSVGPWRYDYEPGYCGELIAADGTTICTFSDEPKAKDALVMSAGPELLEALETVVAQWDALYPSFPTNAKIEDAEFSGFQMARAAIAKARGEQ
ncbi:Uncharacterised protein [Achromobacter xylosoxidans]|uniref:hypothetical protein n=1 Tax=Alcaligenes xylosoxydans xylosoxydans TaxID=85698 RepID=UPI0006C28C75|nr:hypothetical protein [Achromobacter xylosoxidans]CUJ53110.1 Uncharacterised protein [Achromobacter xylosoxidans]